MDRRFPIAFPRARLAAAFMACCTIVGVACSAASAAPTIDVDALWRAFNFSSPQNAYGAWNSQEVRARGYFGGDSPGFDLTNQAEANGIAPAHGQYAVFDDYHQFRKGLFAYAALGAGSGNIFPLHSAYAEIDAQLLPATPLVFGVGGDVSTAGGIVNRYLSLGPTLYFRGGNATLRYIPSASSNNSTGAAGLFTLQLGTELINTAILNVQFGNSPPFLQQAGNVALLSTGERAFDVAFTAKRRLHRDIGVIYGLEYTHIETASTGAPVYVRRGALLGLTWCNAH